MFFYKIPKPTSPGKRHKVQALKETQIYKISKIKALLKGRKNSSGRNARGVITVRHKGGGVKKKLRVIDFTRTHRSVSVVCGVEYDPFRSCFLASVFDLNEKTFSYVLAARTVSVGDLVSSGLEMRKTVGGSFPLGELPVGCSIFNVAQRVGGPGLFSRAAGAFSLIKNKDGRQVVLELTSGEERAFPAGVFATVGEASNDLHFIAELGKAGCSRWANRRPSVRGVAMNPVDHPNGGGEGKQSGKGKTPWGRPTKSGITLSSKKDIKARLLLAASLAEETLMSESSRNKENDSDFSSPTIK